MPAKRACAVGEGGPRDEADADGSCECRIEAYTRWRECGERGEEVSRQPRVNNKAFRKCYVRG